MTCVFCQVITPAKRYGSCTLMRTVRLVKLRSFSQLWKQLLPFIVVAKPMSDLCWTCQQNNTRVVRSANTADEEKSVILVRQQEHLRLATVARSKYNSLSAAAKQTATANPLAIGPHEPNSADISFHYSFDFAQQMMYPDDPLQPGPIYFLVQRRCGLFGVHAEGLSQQVNYLIDEAASTGKGANCGISYLHHYLTQFGQGEKEMHLHADNCVGQNKNSFMMQYLARRVLSGLHTNISIHFDSGPHQVRARLMFQPHQAEVATKRVSCMSDIAELIDASSTANQSQLVSDEV